MTLNEFIAEIESDFRSFSDSGSLDRVSIKRWVTNEMKIFGDNGLELKEQFLTVKNSAAELDPSFRSLKLALKVKPYGKKIKGELDELQNSFIYKRRIEHGAYFDEINMEYVTDCRTKIIEDVITIGNSSAHFYYNKPEWLSLTKGIKKDKIAPTCMNLHPSIRNTYENQINITGNILNTNFSDGSVYIQYYGFPTDEDGELVIPDTKIGALEKYLEAYVKSRIAENLIADNQNPQALGQLLQMYRVDAEKYKKTALTESRWAGLGKNWVRNFKNMNAKDFAAFSLR